LFGQEIWPPEYQTPEALAAKQKAEIARWTPIILEPAFMSTRPASIASVRNREEHRR